MGRIILLVAVGIFAWLALQKFKATPPSQRRKLIFQWTLIALAFAAVVLAISGRLHWVGAAIAVVIPVLNRLWRVFGQHLPWIAPIIAKRAQARQEKSESADERTGEEARQKPPQEPHLTLEEARQILSVSADASRDEIIGAHRRLIQKFHPDRGGNDYLASRINAAKELLLKQLGD